MKDCISDKNTGRQLFLKNLKNIFYGQIYDCFGGENEEFMG